MKALVLYYSMFGHVWTMAKAVAEGVAEVDGAEVVVKRVPETLSDDVIEKMGATASIKAQADVPVADRHELADYDLLCFGTPTRYGNYVAQMGHFIDGTVSLWSQGALIGKVGTVFTSTATQHGGQESTILGFHTFLYHQGMVVTGLPYAFQGQMTLEEITGCSPYGASTIAGGDGSRQPTENELAGARFQGSHAARIAVKLAG
jgi:NAD(P)H dehydrogenase (quinone)